MKIKNLYLNLLSKVAHPTDKQIIEQFVHDLGNEKIKKSDTLLEQASYFVGANPKVINDFDFTDKDELKNYLESVRFGLTKYSSQIVKLRKFPVLDAFVRVNIDKVDKMGQGIILKEHEFEQLCEDAGLSKSLEDINIMYDSNIVFCKIIRLTHKGVTMALAQKAITPERFDELMAILNEDKPADTEELERGEVIKSE